MNILVACEFSGILRRAFRALGHNAWSCDLLEAEDGSPYHIRGDAIHAVRHGVCVGGQMKPWDMVIAHPPCTFLANSGVQWLYLPWKEKGKRGRSYDRDPERWSNMKSAAKFFADLWNACGDIPKAFENPIMHQYAMLEISRLAPDVPFGKHPDLQRIQPWQFGHMESKKTCLYLKGLPHLRPTKIVFNEMQALPKSESHRVHHASPGKERWKERSRTLPGIAEAIAKQFTMQSQ